MTGIRSRAEWNAAPSRGALTHVDPSRRRLFVVHYSTGQELGRRDVQAWLRSIQAFHQGPQRGWSDIGYNLLVSADGDAWEGRGWDAVGAHSPGHNLDGYGVCFLGNDDPGQDVTPAARRTLRELADQADRRSGRRLTRVGHRETQRAGYTTCPGDELVAWIRAGMPLDQAGAPAVKPPLTPPRRPVEPPRQGPAYPGTALQLGSRGRHVVTVQKRLRERGWRIGVDGVFGGETAGVVRRFQAEKRLPVDGVVGPLTWRALWAEPVTP